MKCLEKERELRYQSAVELSEDIDRYLRGKPVEARPSNTFYRFRKLLWRHRSVFMPIGVAIAILVAMTVVFIWSLAKAGERAREEVLQAEREAQALVEQQDRLKRFITDVKGVRRRVDGFFAAGRWEEAFEMAEFADQMLGAAYDFDGYADEVRERIASAAVGEADEVRRLVSQLQFERARERLHELTNLAERLDLGEFRQELRSTAAGFDDICWDAVSDRIQRQERAAAALQRFLLECPNSTYAENARQALDKIRQRLRFTQWPFTAADALERQQTTSNLLDVPVGRELNLGPGVSLPLTLIPAGEFVMGCSAEKGGFNADQRPEHRVRITSPFYVSDTEITREQYESVTGRVLAEPAEADGVGTAGLPAAVTWEEAQLFCMKLARSTKLIVRLPTEAEWEYACRAGSGGLYCGGESTGAGALQEYAWFRENSEQQARAVAQKAANAWGLYDVHGNMLEWCNDWYDSRYYLASPVEDPQGPENGTYRVLRGGSWAHPAEELQCATRDAAQPDSLSPTYGFRVCVELFMEMQEPVASTTVVPLSTR